MECLVIALILAGFAVAALVIVIAGSRNRASSWNDAFRHVSRRFHGVFYAGGWFQEPAAWFQYGDSQARLTLAKVPGSSSERCLQLIIHQREVRSRCEIVYHQTRPGLTPLPRGLYPVEFDWVDFRSRWRVLAADGDEIRHLLSDGVRLSIERLWRHPTPTEMTISLSPGWLVARKVWNSYRGVDVDGFVEHVCALHDQINLAAAAGIEFVAGSEAQLLEDARCAVCGDGLAGDLVVCRRCNTPHHRDCWEYGGGCATYACGGRECLLPRSATLARPHWDDQGSSVERPIKPR